MKLVGSLSAGCCGPMGICRFASGMVHLQSLASASLLRGAAGRLSGVQSLRSGYWPAGQLSGSGYRGPSRQALHLEAQQVHQFAFVAAAAGKRAVTLCRTGFSLGTAVARFRTMPLGRAR